MPESKVALITGITGQDGSYLAEFLLEKGYHVHGLQRKVSSGNHRRITRLCRQAERDGMSIELHYGDLCDSNGIGRLVAEVGPDEIYHLASQSDVALSFKIPEYTADASAQGTLRILEAIRMAGLTDSCRFFQASTSELFGNGANSPQNEDTPFRPNSPYAIAKLYAYWITVNYRESYGLFSANGILFNHESPRRGDNFVTRKITQSLARIAVGLDKKLILGNLDARRDWGDARDYVRAQWLMLQHKEPLDLVIATGRHYSVRDFALRAAKELGVTLEFCGSGLDEVGIVTEIEPGREFSLQPGDVVIEVHPSLFRPVDVNALLGDATRARHLLDWQPQISLDQMVAEMVENDLYRARLEKEAPIQ